MTDTVLTGPSFDPKWIKGILALIISLILMMMGHTAVAPNVFSIDVTEPVNDVRAFPGCEGYGCETTHARQPNAQVCVVKNTNDSGANSLRDCLTRTYPRFIVFNTSGNIFFQSVLLTGAQHSNFAILGQTSPRGVLVTWKRNDTSGGNFPFSFGPVLTGHLNLGWGAPDDFIIRYLRIRHGNDVPANASNSDNFVLTSNKRIVFDHNSITWSDDELFAVYAFPQLTGDRSFQYVTFSCNIMGYGASKEQVGAPPQQAANLGPLFGGYYPVRNISWHNNVMNHQNYRGPLITVGAGVPVEGGFQIKNNVYYNYRAGMVQPDMRYLLYTENIYLDVVNNYFKTGPDTGLSINTNTPFWMYNNGAAGLGNGNFTNIYPSSFYFVGNVRRWIDDTPYNNQPGTDAPDSYNYTSGYGGAGYGKWIILHGDGTPAHTYSTRTTPLPSAPIPVTLVTADQVYTNLITNRQCGTELKPPGATQCQLGACVDNVDDYILTSITNGGDWIPQYSPGHSGTGSYPDLVSNHTPWVDSDDDGLPDDIEDMMPCVDKNTWENQALEDCDGDGYVNIEDWANGFILTGVL